MKFDFIKNKKLGNFIKHIIYHPFPVYNQRYFGEKEDMFMEDLFTIEMAKYFYIGEEKYCLDPIPRRLSCTGSFKVEYIVSECKKFERKIIQDEKDIENSSILRIENVGRGLQLFLLTEQRAWKEIIAYDEDLRYFPLLTGFFQEEFFSNRFWTTDDKLTIPKTKGDQYVYSSMRLHI